MQEKYNKWSELLKDAHIDVYKLGTKGTFMSCVEESAVDNDISMEHMTVDDRSELISNIPHLVTECNGQVVYCYGDMWEFNEAMKATVFDWRFNELCTSCGGELVKDTDSDRDGRLIRCDYVCERCGQ